MSVLLPALALVGLAVASVPDLGPGPRADLATAGALALAVVSTAFTGQAISTGFDRRAGVLRLLGTTPLGRGGLLAAKGVAVLSVLAVQVVVLGALGLALGARPEAGGILPTLAEPPARQRRVRGPGPAAGRHAARRGGARRGEPGLGAAARARRARARPTCCPAPSRTVAALLPSGALGDAVRLSFVDGAWPWAQWAVLVGWAVVGGLLTRRFFRWGD